MNTLSFGRWPSNVRLLIVFRFIWKSMLSVEKEERFTIIPMWIYLKRMLEEIFLQDILMFFSSGMLADPHHDKIFIMHVIHSWVEFNENFIIFFFDKLYSNERFSCWNVIKPITNQMFLGRISWTIRVSNFSIFWTDFSKWYLLWPYKSF